MIRKRVALTGWATSAGTNEAVRMTGNAGTLHAASRFLKGKLRRGVLIWQQGMGAHAPALSSISLLNYPSLSLMASHHSWLVFFLQF